MGMETETEAGQPGGPLPQSCPQKAVAKAPKRTRKQQKSRAKRSKTSSKPKKKRKRAGQPSSAFCPQEPEIKLKYATYREEKRDVRAAAFAPYVHLEKKEFSRCTVVNYLEEETGGLKKGRVRPAGPGCWRPARSPPPRAWSWAGWTRRAGGGPTRRAASAAARPTPWIWGPPRAVPSPQGPGPGARAPAQPRAPRTRRRRRPAATRTPPPRWASGERGRVREWRRRRRTGAGAQPRRPSPGRGGTLLWRLSAAGSATRTACRTPRPKRPVPRRTAATSAAPRPALHSGEFWLHEDCGVWSTGVFLVRGRLYGLEEAVRLAQGTVCSTCHAAGATLGCFFKGCPNKYHYRCALLSDCVLNEENFTMKCTKHKNKCLKGVSRTENSPVCFLGRGVCTSADVEFMSAARDPVPSLAAVAMTTTTGGRTSVELRAGGSPSSASPIPFHL
ncbi:hypothetical protein ANANG_G00296260 [Anguilla anguilla]|uniref:PHD-type domain-containing protein n=1 Tax=Anguilla anguilla TaxID=7936 RepID=A0A9D3LPT4_ANGAN|nr:hypothetical protein ANANG_G00296260 [Anguilla anguilla]